MSTHRIDKVMAEALADWVINTGEGYQKRCDAARVSEFTGNMTFASIAVSGARDYERHHRGAGEPQPHLFNRATVLYTAALIAEYYGDHVAELNKTEREGASP